VRRRTLLSGVVASTVGLAGCGEFGENSDRGNYGVPGDGSGGEDGSGPALPPGLTRVADAAFGPRRRMVISTLPGERAPPGTRFTVGFVETATAESPPRVWTALTNVGDEDRTVTLGTTPPFSGYLGHTITWSRSGDIGLVLVPDDDREYANFDLVIPDEPQNATLRDGIVGNESDGTADAGDGTGEDAPAKCWRARSLLAAPDRTNEVTLAPGESITGEYVLLWYHGIWSCPARRGGYHFEDEREDLGLVISAWDPGLEAPGTAVLDRSVPGLPGYDATVWYHLVDADAAVYLEPTRERLTTPRDRLTVTFQNFSFGTLAVDPWDWDLYRLEDDGWRRAMDPRQTGDPGPVPPGGGSRVSLRVGTAPEDPDGNLPYAGDLEPGVYAVRHGTTGGVDTDGRGPLRIENRVRGEGEVTYAALVRLGASGEAGRGDPGLRKRPVQEGADDTLQTREPSSTDRPFPDL
jgi:hypothetical protein